MHKEKIGEAIIYYFNQNNITYSFKDDVFHFDIAVDDLRFSKFRYIIIILNDSYVVYSKYPIKADTSDSRIYELICKINNVDVSGGNFEISDNGEIRYKYYVPCDETIPTQNIIEQSIYTSLRFFVEYSDSIADVIFTDASAKEAFEHCEPEAIKLLKLFKDANTSSSIVPDFAGTLNNQYKKVNNR